MGLGTTGAEAYGPPAVATHGEPAGRGAAAAGEEFVPMCGVCLPASGGQHMASYLFQVAYTSDSWAMQVTSQPNVVERITPLVEKCGGTIRDCFYAFGDYDVVLLADFATPEGAAAFSLGATAGGATKTIKTTELLTVDQGRAAMRTAAEARSLYTPPLQGSVAAQRQQPASA